MGWPSCCPGRACMAHARGRRAGRTERWIEIGRGWFVVYLAILQPCGGRIFHFVARIEAGLGALERYFRGLKLWCRAWGLW